MCVLCFLILLFLIYAIIGIIAGSIFNYKYKWKVDLYKYTWKVDLNVSPEKFGLCWPKYVPILISEFKDEKKQSNRNIVLATLDDIEYDKTNSSEKSNSNVNTGLFTSLGLTGAYLALNQELVESFKTGDCLEFKGKRYMVDTNGNILPLKYMMDINGNIL
jgi:hypothetical protein